MNELLILTTLVKGGLSPIGACAMGGNMMAESVMKSINLQDTYERALGYNDNTYTTAVDAGSYDKTRFSRDQAGYGLCQWTEKSRKEALYDFAKAKGASIGDEVMQAEFCLHELKTQYASLMEYLRGTGNLYEATSKICKEFERPAINNISERSQFANGLYMSFGALLEQAVASPTSNTGTQGGISNDFVEAVDNRGNYSDLGLVCMGEHTPQAAYLKALLKNVGYDVLWMGLDACLRDFQLKRGLIVDGICGEQTWTALLG